jgi:UDP-N-acetyl-D-galactosamine dehydrogenase
MILAGRRINDGMGAYVAQRVIKLMDRRHRPSADPRILVLGLSFKENCPDLRNTKVTDIVHELQHYSAIVDVHDPWVDASEAQRQYGLALVAEPEAGRYDAVILAVGHTRFRERGAVWMRSLLGREGVLFDVKSLLPAADVDGRL